ncbi:NAD(P)-binding protein [Ophiobolus disseminans]|uniref:NAD(P)-binding protein n=1 Tax=Ophiobolus disseminans TaxID=1469910 RepID=A0A6A6ZZH7_9PLEO|nr:NAD(P)-binding protein [Ophiobolus disseminans]
MTYPRTCRAWRRSTTPFPRHLVLSTETLPETLGANDVLIRIHAVSLNYRDVAMLEEGKYPVPVEHGGISASDCAAEVVDVGPGVTKFAAGEHVTVTVDLLSLTLDDREMSQVALGGNGPGTLREFAVFEDKVLVKLPSHLSWVEASTLTVAGLTAWNALDGLKRLPTNATALLQGTGGVSVMTLLICVAAGIKPIITSSSDDKLAKLKKISPAIEGINYKTCDVKTEALRLTQGKGVDFLVNNVGLSSIPDDLDVMRKQGSIALVGFLGGFEANFNAQLLFSIMLKACKLQGILGGSRDDFEALNAFLDTKKVRLEAIVDKVFSFDVAPEAFDYLASGKHVGKIVIQVA